MQRPFVPSVPASSLSLICSPGGPGLPRASFPGAGAGAGLQPGGVASGQPGEGAKPGEADVQCQAASWPEASSFTPQQAPESRVPLCAGPMCGLPSFRVAFSPMGVWPAEFQGGILTHGKERLLLERCQRCSPSHVALMAPETLSGGLWLSESGTDGGGGHQDQ